MSSSPSTPATGRRRVPRGTLNPDVIVNAAIAVIDEEDLDALTIGRLAKRLGVRPTSLYTHFRDKDAILLAVAAELFRQFEMPEWNPSDLEMLREIMRAFFRHLIDNPVLLRLYAAGEEANPAELPFTDAIYGCLDRLRIDPAEAVELSATLLRFVIGSALVYPRRTWEDDPARWSWTRRRMGQTDSYPAIRKLTRGEVPPFTQQEAFESGLTRLLSTIRS